MPFLKKTGYHRLADDDEPKDKLLKLREKIGRVAHKTAKWFVEVGHEPAYEGLTAEETVQWEFYHIPPRGWPMTWVRDRRRELAGKK